MSIDRVLQSQPENALQVCKELEKMWKKTVIACLKILSQNFLGRTEKSHRISKEEEYPCPDSNPVPPEC
jgi:hypothetical protein